MAQYCIVITTENNKLLLTKCEKTKASYFQPSLEPMYLFKESDIVLDMGDALNIVRNGRRNLEFTDHFDISSNGDNIMAAGDDAAWGFTAKDPFRFLIKNIFDSSKERFFNSLFARERL